MDFSCHPERSEGSMAPSVAASANSWILRVAQDDNPTARGPGLSRPPTAAFSLIEVVIAAGIFAVAIASILALLPALTRQSANSADTLTALQLPDAIRVELQRLVAEGGGLDTLAGRVGPMTALPPETLTLVATRDGAFVQSRDYPSPTTGPISEDAQYFVIEAWGFSQAPLAFDPGGTILALHVRVSWPYHVPGTSGVTPVGGRDEVSFNVVSSR